MRARAYLRAGATMAAVVVLGGGARAAQAPADDLTVVKRAVAEGPAPAAPAVKASPPAARAGQPQWFKVRIVDKGSRKGRVTVNLPLALVRALGDAPLDWRCRGQADRDHRCSIKVADVLEALEAGQQLVEIDDDETTVKIWVE